jgi:hypothetical protein
MRRRARRSAQPLALTEVTVKIIVALLLAAAGFWAGHAYSSYRMEGKVMPTLQRFQALRSAALMVQSVELIDAGQTTTLRGKLLAAAESQINPLPNLPTNWRAVFAPPFSVPGDSIESLASSNDTQASTLREKIHSLARQGAPGGSTGKG